MQAGVDHHATRHKATHLSFRTPITMSISVGGGEPYPGRSFSIAQLLYAAKRKLQDITPAGR